MPKKTNLNLGFLLLYDWLPAIYELPAKEVKALLIALVERQREGKPLPIFKNRMTNSFALMIEPVIKRRLDGQAGGKKGHEGGEVPPPVTSPQREDEESAEKEKISLFERRKEEIYKSLTPEGSAPEKKSDEVFSVSPQAPTAPGSAPKEKTDVGLPTSLSPIRQNVFSPSGTPALPACEVSMGEDLSYDERGLLLGAGVPSEYLNERLPRAREWAAKTKKRAYTILLEWWGQDKATQHRRTGNLQPSNDSSFDADEVFATMLAKTYGCDRNSAAPTDA